MAHAHDPEPLKYFIAILYRTPESFKAGKHAVSEVWGALDFEGNGHLFDMTDYYEPEMGTPLYRRLVAFEHLLPPTAIVDMKLRCIRIEDRLAIDGRRIVNLDAGYLDHNKVVLASVKNFGHKIYLDHGIYADCVGLYKQGRYQPFDWTFPDFKDGRYDQELLTIRRRYLQQMRQWRKLQKTPA